MSSPVVPPVATTTNLVDQLVAEFMKDIGSLTLQNLAVVAVAIAQKVLQSVNPQLSVVIEVLVAWAQGSAFATEAERAQLLQVIQTVMPTVLSLMTNIETGAIELVGKVVTEVQEEASSIWTWCSKKKKPTTADASTQTPATPPNSPQAIEVAKATAYGTIPPIVAQTQYLRSLSPPLAG